MGRCAGPPSEPRAPGVSHGIFEWDIHGELIGYSWGFNGELIGFNGICSWDLIGFHGICSWDLIGFHGIYPPVNIRKAMENGPLIVDFNGIVIGYNGYLCGI